MVVVHSFKDYVAKKFGDKLWEVAERYLNDNKDSICDELCKIHCAGEMEISDIHVEHVWVNDMPGMKIQFDVALSILLEISEGDHHYDNSEEKTIWIMIQCIGDLACELNDCKIYSVTEYNGKNRVQHPLDDTLVPYIPYDKLEMEAKDILNEYYPEALQITPNGKPPVWVDPSVLAKRMGLTIKTSRINEDATVFGQIYFEATDAELFDVDSMHNKRFQIDAQTIVVDPEMFLLRNLGSVNNTIVHECVHWREHRKAFLLERLFNEEISCISCEVVGEAISPAAKKATEIMERQANQLAPRIQMPEGPFRAKANECIGVYMRSTNAKHVVDIMENVIRELERDFGVSRQAAKIRLVELGFDEALGTFTYIDGHYVKPYGFSKDSIKLNQTFTISKQDAAIQRFVNPELKALTNNGDYLFIDNHYVYNAPLYVTEDENGRLGLTDYARYHMDECCLAFDMKITSNVESACHTACYLNREPSNITFDITYHNGYQNAPQERQIAMRQKQQDEWIAIRRQMTDDPEQCMQLLLDWREMNLTDLGLKIDRDAKTISRTLKSKTNPKVETAALICFGLNLPPMISDKLMEVFGCKLSPIDQRQQWINEALHVKYPEPLPVIREYLASFGVEL